MNLRTIPPTAAPVELPDLWNGVVGLFRSHSTVARLTRNVKLALGVKHLFFVSSGRAALALILTALARLSSRRRVIIPAYTCYSVPAAVVRAGLEVVPCDIDPATLDFDYDHLETLLAEAPAMCVVPTHIFGLSADVGRTLEACRPGGVFVVEDAAQAFGILIDGCWLGTSSDVGFYSFGRGKTVSAVAGGAIVTNSDCIAGAIEATVATLREPGPLHAFLALAEAALVAVFVHPSLYWLPATLPFLGLGETHYSSGFDIRKISGAQAGLLLRWKQRTAEMNRARRSLLEELMPAVRGIAPPRGRPWLRLPLLCRSREERDRLCAKGAGRTLGLTPMYPAAVNRIAELTSALSDSRVPNAERVADRLLTVPMHPLLSASDVKAIRELLLQAGEPKVQ